MTTRSSFMDRDNPEGPMKICFVFLWLFYTFLWIFEIGANFCHLKEFENWLKNGKAADGLNLSCRLATTGPCGPLRPRPSLVRGKAVHGGSLAALATTAARHWARGATMGRRRRWAHFTVEGGVGLTRRRSAVARLLGWRRVQMRRQFQWPSIVTWWFGSFTQKWGRVSHRSLAETTANHRFSSSDGGAGDDSEENWRYSYSADSGWLVSLRCTGALARACWDTRWRTGSNRAAGRRRARGAVKMATTGALAIGQKWRKGWGCSAVGWPVL
jgi:hypothetical protein